MAENDDMEILARAMKELAAENAKLQAELYARKADSARVEKLERLLNRMNIEELMDLLTGDLHVREAIDSVQEEE